MMPATELSPKQLNFARFSIVCLEIIKLPLIDILNIFIKPKDLSTAIKANRYLLSGNVYSNLNRHQQNKCLLCPNQLPNYSNFDISLLYKLIRYLCPQLKPNNNWGKTPTINDTDVGDDIERIRELRNKSFGHIESAKFKNNKFKRLWDHAKGILERLERYTKQNGCNSDYIQQFEDLGRKTLTFDEYTTQKKRSEGRHSSLQYLFYQYFEKTLCIT